MNGEIVTKSGINIQTRQSVERDDPTPTDRLTGREPKCVLEGSYQDGKRKGKSIFTYWI